MSKGSIMLTTSEAKRLASLQKAIAAARAMLAVKIGTVDGVLDALTPKQRASRRGKALRQQSTDLYAADIDLEDALGALGKVCQ